MKISDYKIEDDSTLQLFVKESKEDTMQVFVKDLDNKTIVFSVNREDTVLSLKRQIELRTGVRVDDQHLSHHSKPMDSNKTLMDYGVVHG